MVLVLVIFVEVVLVVEVVIVVVMVAVVALVLSMPFSGRLGVLVLVMVGVAGGFVIVGAMIKVLETCNFWA